MLKFNSLVHPFALFFIFLVFSPSSAHNKTHVASPPEKKTHEASSLNTSYKGSFSKVFAFGDSYTDSGNSQSLSGIKSGSSSENRLCDGRLVVDFLCEALSLPHLPPYNPTSSNFTHGVNFATSGSTAFSSHQDFANHKFPPTQTWNKEVHGSSQTQIDCFNKFLQEVECKGKDSTSCKAEMGKALFWIGEMGMKDYTHALGSPFTLGIRSETSVDHTCTLLQTLLDNGAKYIVVQGLPPLGCLSSGISLCPSSTFDKMGCAVKANSAVMIHNAILQKKLVKFRSQYPDSTILYGDYWNAYFNILMNKEKYQFEEPYKACCGGGGGKLNFHLNTFCGSSGASVCKEPSKYMNWDGVHLTEAMHKHVADLFLNQGFCEPSFHQLIKTKSCI